VGKLDATPPPGLVHRVLARLARAPQDAAASLIPTAPPVPLATTGRRFWPFVRSQVGWLLVGLVPVALLPIVETVEIWLFQVVVDDVLAPRDISSLPVLAGAFLALTLATGVLAYVDDVIATRVGEQFTLAVRGAIFRHLLRQAPDSLDRRHLGDLLARVSGDVGAVEGLMVAAPGELFSAIIRAVLFAGAMVLIDPALALVSLLLAPLFWGAARLFASAVRGLSRERRRRSGGVMAIAEESLSHAPLVQASGREADELRRFMVEGEAAASAAVASARLRSMLLPAVDLLEVAGALVITGLGTLALAEGRLSLGELLVFLTYLTQLYRPVRDLGELMTTAYTASGAAERILEILDHAPDVVEAPDAIDPGRVRGVVTLDHVGYSYGSPQSVLSALTATFEPGTITAVVGPSGAGKSTLVKLLLRFADPTSGRILIDGRDARELSLRGLRRNVSVLLQDSHILDASLVENVRYARPDASDEEVRAALEAAAAVGFSDALDDDGRRRLSQHGRRLSGGQRKRIEIARLVLQDAPIVILDEPTASLDPATARSVLRALRTILARRTVILITHDPVAHEVADRIMTLEAGRLVGSADAVPVGERGLTPSGSWTSPATGDLTVAGEAT
jgi:ATP-binding cassette, subfamily B, bacterial